MIVVQSDWVVKKIFLEDLQKAAVCIKKNFTKKY